MPVYAYADPTGQYRRWYPNIKQLRHGKTSGAGYWGQPGSDVKGHRTGGSYSRHAAKGKGLSDVGYAKYITSEVKAKGHAVVVNPASYLMGMAELGKQVGWAGKPGYKGSGLEARVRQEAVISRGMTGMQTTEHAPSGIGHALMGGMGRGEWERPQIKKEEAKGGTGVGTVMVLGGVGYLLWSLLK